jgi:hypothetical protein
VEGAEDLQAEVAAAEAVEGGSQVDKTLKIM